jgi:hypothetical protein
VSSSVGLALAALAVAWGSGFVARPEEAGKESTPSAPPVTSVLASRHAAESALIAVNAAQSKLFERIPEATGRTIADLLRDATRTLNVITMPYHELAVSPAARPR